MSTASVTLKISVSELDVIRAALRTHRDNASEASKDEATHPQKRQELRQVAMQANTLLERLGL